MKKRYDFSKAVRGKFYKANAVFKLPVYLDAKVETYLAAKADSKGVRSVRSDQRVAQERYRVD